MVVEFESVVVLVVVFERYSMDLCIVVGIGNSNLGFVRLLYRHSSMDLVCMELVLFVEPVVLLVLELMVVVEM